MILGLHQYTHSASLALAKPATGEVVFAGAKERLTRKKYDGGDCADLVRESFAALGLTRTDVTRVVTGNHLFRVPPFAHVLPFTTALNQWPPSYLAAETFARYPGGPAPAGPADTVPAYEVSHHLAHAWSVLPVAPFDEGLVVVLDGMGSLRADVLAGDGERYVTDANLPAADGFLETTAPVTGPRDPRPAQGPYGFREGESVYAFSGLALRRVFKRWVPERNPSFLYNYGFEELESLGALYSRIASHVFGDWNACGKVMGLVAHDRPARRVHERAPRTFLFGALECLEVDWARLRALPGANAWESGEHFDAYARAAAAMQDDLEAVVLDFLAALKARTGAENVCLVGGVFLNSLLNGRIVREAPFARVFIPPHPGDDGIAVGLAHFGAFGPPAKPGSEPLPGGRGSPRTLAAPALRAPRRPLSPFLGRRFARDAIEVALAEVAPFVCVEAPDDPLGTTADALAAHEVVAWYRGRAEFGPRALGNRSILAHPGRPQTVTRINAMIKRREAFRPFAPTVLAEQAGEWFDFDRAAAPAVSARPQPRPEPIASPYMSLTLPALSERAAKIAAVVHADGSARLQTLRRADNPRFYALIEAFCERTGLPLVLNTSFNLGREPIVERPGDALAAFLDSDLDRLVFDDAGLVVTRRPFPEPPALPGLTPRLFGRVQVEVTAQAGEPESETIVLSSGGRQLEIDGLTADVFDASDGTQTVAEIAANLSDSATEAAVVAALRLLHEAHLIAFEPPVT